MYGKLGLGVETPITAFPLEDAPQDAAGFFIAEYIKESILTSWLIVDGVFTSMFHGSRKLSVPSCEPAHK